MRGGAIVDDHEDRFVWTWYGSSVIEGRDRRAQLRAGALSAFATDLRAHPKTYVAGALPDLPFGDDAFDVALCSHLLFTWADTFDAEWHRRALTELLRVAAQLRVFPLVHSATGDPVGFLPGLVDDLGACGHEARIVDVSYEFQRGGNHMLVLRR